VLKSILSSPYVSVLEQALAASSLRQKVISNNIANVNTPGFKKSEVAFEDVLQEALDDTGLPLTQTNERHLPVRQVSMVTPRENMVGNTSLRTDGNNVDIDVEMAEMAKNSIYYDAVVKQLSHYITDLKSAISGGK
jgi:flagellar basal-body rod protein FlgB